MTNKIDDLTVDTILDAPVSEKVEVADDAPKKPIMMKKFSKTERHKLIDQLDVRGLFFQKFWGCADIFWTDVIPTAAVTSANNRIQFLFNPEFFNGLGDNGKLFVICHEQLHLINNHFTRLKFSEGNSKLKNVAADVAINELLIRNFSFKKTDLPNHENYCWLDTVFKDDEYSYVSDNETAEYYYSILLAKQEKMQKELAEKIKNGEIEIKPDSGADGMGAGDGLPIPLDDHIFSEQQDHLSDELREAIEDALEKFEEANPESKEVKQAAKRIQYRKGKKAGNEVGIDAMSYNFPVPKRKSWKRLWQHLCKSVHDNRQSGHWAFTDRKMALLKTGVDLPGEYTQEYTKKTRVLVYLDTSGSCINDTKFFLKNAMSLPKDLFEVKYFGFDTEVYPISKKPPYKLREGGGTSFDCISRHVEEEMGYYDAVFIFTDGEAGKTVTKNPKRWIWFITPNGTDDAITDGSTSFKLGEDGMEWDAR